MDLVNASQAGTESGLKVPSIAGAVVNGLNEAYQTYQKNSYVQAQTANLQADTALHDAQAANLLTGTAHAKLQAQTDLTTARANYEQGKVQQQNEFQKLSQTVAEGDPTKIKSLLSDQGSMATLFKYPKDAPIILGTMRSKVGNDPEASQMLDTLTANIKAANFNNGKASIEDQIKNHSITTGLKAIRDVMDDGIIHDLDPTASDPSKFLSENVAYPRGKQPTVSVNGKTYLDKGGTGNPSADTKGNWDVFNTKTNELVGTLPANRAVKLNTARNGYTAQLGELYKQVYPESIGTGSSGQQGQVIAQGGTQDAVTGQTNAPSATPNPASTPVPGTNPNIAPQAQAALKSNTFLPGVNVPNVESALAARQQQWSQRFRDQGKAAPVLPGTPGAVSPTPQGQSSVPTAKNTLFIPSPEDSLTTASGTPIALANINPVKVRPEVYQAIQGNPLLSNQDAIVKGLAAVESQGGLTQLSKTGVRGLLQVTKGTAADMGFDRDIPEQNVLAGKAYINKQIHDFKGNLQLAFAAYSAAGPAIVHQAVRELGTDNWNDVKQYLRENLSTDKYNQVKDYPDRAITATAQFLSPTNAEDKKFLALMAFNNLISAKKAA